jgi:hypothetical protein
MYLKMSFGAWKSGGCYVSHTPHPEVFALPLGVTMVFPPVTVFTLVRVLRVVFRLRAHVPLVSLSVSLEFDTLAPLPLRSLGQEISQWWWWCHPCRGGLHSGPLPTGPSMNRARSWVRPMPAGALCQLCGGDGMDLRQLAVQPFHPVDGGWWWRVYEFGCSGCWR